MEQRKSKHESEWRRGQQEQWNLCGEPDRDKRGITSAEHNPTTVSCAFQNSRQPRSIPRLVSKSHREVRVLFQCLYRLGQVPATDHLHRGHTKNKKEQKKMGNLEREWKARRLPSKRG